MQFRRAAATVLMAGVAFTGIGTGVAFADDGGTTTAAAAASNSNSTNGNSVNGGNATSVSSAVGVQGPTIAVAPFGEATAVGGSQVVASSSSARGGDATFVSDTKQRASAAASAKVEQAKAKHRKH